MRSIILAGAPRSGKTTLAKRLQAETRFSLLSGDALVCSFGGIFPQLEIFQQSGTEKTSENLKYFLRAWLEQYHRYQHIPFILDIYQLKPEQVVEFKFHDLYNVVFFGYPNADPKEKLQQIRTYRTDHYDWTDEKDDSEILGLIERYIERSKVIQKSCADFGLSFIDTSFDFLNSLEKAHHILTQSLDLTKI